MALNFVTVEPQNAKSKIEQNKHKQQIKKKQTNKRREAFSPKKQNKTKQTNKQKHVLIK